MLATCQLVYRIVCLQFVLKRDVQLQPTNQRYICNVSSRAVSCMNYSVSQHYHLFGGVGSTEVEEKTMWGFAVIWCGKWDNDVSVLNDDALWSPAQVLETYTWLRFFLMLEPIVCCKYFYVICAMKCFILYFMSIVTSSALQCVLRLLCQTA